MEDDDAMISFQAGAREKTRDSSLRWTTEDEVAPPPPPFVPPNKCFFFLIILCTCADHGR
jgi:hypothetical protein